MRLRSLPACVAAVALMTTGLVSTASGAPDDALIDFVQTIEIAPNYSINGGTRHCEADERVLSGGFVQQGSPDPVELRVTGPVGADGDFGASDGERPIGWTAMAVNSASEAIDMKLLPVCAKAGAVMAVKRFTNSTGEAKRVTVDCPGNRRALGGGIIQKTNPGNDFLKESGPTDGSKKFGRIRTGDIPTGWRGVLHSQEDGDVYKLIAVCVRNSQATMKVATRMPSSPSFDSDHRVRCPNDKRAVGGGLLYRGSASSGYGLGGLGPLDSSSTYEGTTSGDVPKYWYGSIQNVSGGPIDNAYKVIALCE